MSVLDAKVDERFVRLLDDSDSIDEAIARWSGVSRDEVEKLVDSILISVSNAVWDMSRRETEVAVLKMLKPEATVRDYLVLRALTSIVRVRDGPEVPQAGGFDALLAPEPGKPSVVLAFPDLTIAVKGGNDVLGSIMQVAGGIIGAETPTEAMLNLAGTMAALGGLGANSPRKDKGGEDNGEGDTEQDG